MGQDPYSELLCIMTSPWLSVSIQVSFDSWCYCISPRIDLAQGVNDLLLSETAFPHHRVPTAYYIRLAGLNLQLRAC